MATINRIEVAEATFALPEPLLVGGSAVSSRDYTCVRMTSSAGLEGWAYGITRGLPVAQVAERMVAPRYLGRDVIDPAATHRYVTDQLGFLAGDSCVSRALSLLDIAAWDVAGHHAGRPVTELLGDDSRPRGAAPVLMAVDGYLPASGNTAGTRRLVEESLAAGISTIKFAALADPVASASAILEVAPEATSGELSVVVDLLWSLSSAAQGHRVAATLEDVAIEWIEDPYPAHVLRADREAAQAFGKPVAFGDEATDPHMLYELAATGLVDVVRIDATTVGGLTGAAALVQRVHELGRPVACHIYPEVHQHLAYSEVAADYVEMFPVDGRFDAADQFRTETVRVSGGTIEEPTSPGLGLHLDWDAVVAHSTSHCVIEET